jgi:hypothetical protein
MLLLISTLQGTGNVSEVTSSYVAQLGLESGSAGLMPVSLEVTASLRAGMAPHSTYEFTDWLEREERPSTGSVIGCLEVYCCMKLRAVELLPPIHQRGRAGSAVHWWSLAWPLDPQHWEKKNIFTIPIMFLVHLCSSFAFSRLFYKCNYTASSLLHIFL